MAKQKDDQLQQQHQPHGSKTEQDQDYTVPIFSPKSLPRRRRIKYCGIAIALVLLQIVVIGVLALTVFRLRDPNIKLTAVTLDNFNTVLGNPTTINMTLRGEIKVTNRNWGRLKYDETILVLSHENLQVGQGTISRGSIKMRHSKIVTVFVEAKIDGGLNSSSSSSEISSGVLNLKSYVMLSGKVNVVGVVRKRRDAEMNCSLTVSLTRQAIQEFHCK